MSSCCPPVQAMSVEQLAGWLAVSCEWAEGVLFTATARQDLDGIASWQRLADVVFAGQCRAIVAAVNRAGRAER